MKTLITLICILASSSLYAQKYQFSGENKGRFNLSGDVLSKHITSVKGVKFYWLTLADNKIINITDSSIYHAVQLNGHIEFASCDRLITNYNARSFAIPTPSPVIIAESKGKRVVKN